MNNIQDINNWFKNFEQRMHKDVPVIVSETATAFYQERFRTQEWDGVPWDTLNPTYKRQKRRSKNKILTASGILVNSIRPSTVTQNKVIVSAGNSKAPYARIHNEGLRVRGIRYVKPFTNNNFMGTGRRQQIRGHSRKVNYKMPRRQFMGHSRFLNEQITTRLIYHFNN